MAKRITHAMAFRDPRQTEIGPDRYLYVAACDDGSIYEFQSFDDSPHWSIRARGSRDEPRSEWSHRASRLPGDVKTKLGPMLEGFSGWR